MKPLRKNSDSWIAIPHATNNDIARRPDGSSLVTFLRTFVSLPRRNMERCRVSYVGSDVRQRFCVFCFDQVEDTKNRDSRTAAWSANRDTTRPLTPQLRRFRVRGGNRERWCAEPAMASTRSPAFPPPIDRQHRSFRNSSGYAPF